MKEEESFVDLFLSLLLLFSFALPRTLGTRITIHTLCLGEFNQTIGTLDDFELVGRPNTKLHGGSGLLTARGAVTPTRQIRVAFDASFKVAAHAFPTTSSHDDQ